MPSFHIPTFDSSAHIKREDPRRVMKGSVWTQQQSITPHSSGQSCLCLQPWRTHTLDHCSPSAGETEGSGTAAQTFYVITLKIKTSLLAVFLKSCAFSASACHSGSWSTAELSKCTQSKCQKEWKTCYLRLLTLLHQYSQL